MVLCRWGYYSRDIYIYFSLDIFTIWHHCIVIGSYSLGFALDIPFLLFVHHGDVTKELHVCIDGAQLIQCITDVDIGVHRYQGLPVQSERAILLR